MFSKIMLSLILLPLTIALQILIFINGWGLEPQSWNWIIWGAILQIALLAISLYATHEHKIKEPDILHGNMSSITVKDGDIITFTVPAKQYVGNYTEFGMDGISSLLSELFPHNPYIILHGDEEISVIRKE